MRTQWAGEGNTENVKFSRSSGCLFGQAAMVLCHPSAEEIYMSAVVLWGSLSLSNKMDMLLSLTLLPPPRSMLNMDVMPSFCAQDENVFERNLGYPDWSHFACWCVKGKALPVQQNGMQWTPSQETWDRALSQKDINAWWNNAFCHSSRILPKQKYKTSNRFWWTH